MVDILKSEGYVGHCMKTFLKNLDSKLVERHNARYTKEHEDEPYSRRHAIMNLLGYFSFRLGESQNAIVFFKKIFNEDPTNINALLNLRFVFKDLGLRKDAAKNEDLIQNILDGDPLKVEAAKARALFEYATAMTCTEEAYILNDHVTVSGCFEDALKHVGLVDIREQNEWWFGLAFLYLRMDSVYGVPEVDKYFKEAFKYFYKVAVSPPPKDDTRSAERREVYEYHRLIERRQSDMRLKSWCFMGTLLARFPNRKDFNFAKVFDDLNTQSKITVCLDNAHRTLGLLDCLQKVVSDEMSNDSPEILKRVGQAYTNIGRDMEEAKKYLKRAIEVQPTSGYGYHLLGLWFLKKYELTNRKQFIDNAIEQFECAKKMNCNIFVMYRSLAKAHRLNGDIENALYTCTECFKSRGGDRNDKLYDLWAEILNEHGDIEGAAEKRRHAESLRRGEHTKTREFGVVYCAKDAEDVAHIVHKLENKLHIEGYYFDRDADLGSDIFEEWGSIDAKCRMIIVFVSEAFLNDNKRKRTLGEVIDSRDDNNTAHTIIPVLLNGNTKLPTGLKNNRAIAYEDSDCFWRMLKKLFDA